MRMTEIILHLQEEFCQPVHRKKPNSQMAQRQKEQPRQVLNMLCPKRDESWQCPVPRVGPKSGAQRSYRYSIRMHRKQQVAEVTGWRQWSGRIGSVPARGPPAQPDVSPAVPGTPALKQFCIDMYMDKV